MVEPRTILIVTTTFFPHPTVSAVRMTQWCRHLPEFGWHPVVVSRYYGFRATQQQLAEQVHPDVDVRYLNGPPETSLAARTVEPARQPDQPSRTAATKGWLSRVKSRLRAPLADIANQLVVPDVSIFFWRKMRSRLDQILREVRPQVLLTTGPSHANHDVGLWLAERGDNLPWVADFRDPYTLSPGYRPRGMLAFRFPAHYEYERRIYENCQLATHVNELHARWARMSFPACRSRIRYLPNGIPREILTVTPEASVAGPRRLVFCSAGVIGCQEILTVARALQQLVSEGVDLELRLVGTPPENLAEITALLGERAQALGRMPHQQALQQIADADVLLCLQSASRASLVGLSSKLFEYLAAGSAVVVVNNSRPARRFLSEFQGVYCVDNPTPLELADMMRRAIAPGGAPPADQVSEFRQRYSRRNQVQTLAEWLNALSASAATRDSS